MKILKEHFAAREINFYRNCVTNVVKILLIFQIGVFWLEKNAEMVLYGQTEENLQLPECTAFAALQGHMHRLELVL